MASSPRHIEVIVTLGPATQGERMLRRLKAKDVDFVRLNMSHSTTEELRRAIVLAKKVGIPFIVDTEGSQVRTGALARERVDFSAGDKVRLYQAPVRGSRRALSLTPGYAVDALRPGDLLYCDFDSLTLAVADVSTRARGFITARTVFGGSLGSNKGVYVETADARALQLPPLSPKDYESIRIGLEEGVGAIAASFMRSGEAVRAVREATKSRMRVISKVECIDGLEHLDEIIEASDALLIDRGDLSKEISLERVPFTQKIIVHRARRAGKPAIVATNFLESMIANRRPTRAEIHDIESSVTDGAAGLTLAAETAVGAHPIACVGVMRSVIDHVCAAIDPEAYAAKEEVLVARLEKNNYLCDVKKHASLIPPHGGALVFRYRPELLETLPRRMRSLTLTEEEEMDAEQLALGAFSPLEGFMGKKELTGVLERMRLPSGVVWPLPIVLAATAREARGLRAGQKVLLNDHTGVPFALLNLTEKYRFDRTRYATQLYGTLDERHPGVRAARKLSGVFLAGSVDLLRRRDSETAAFELTPAQTRRLFESVGWRRIVGFHTRNAIHRAHEHMQRAAVEEVFADGLFVHPVVGKKKKGDFSAAAIIESYAPMLRRFYPKHTVVFAALATYSRYAGPREALFTALVRQNFGCSHFIVGRDHTGVGNFYDPLASQEIFDRFPELLITPVRFGAVRYSKKRRAYMHEGARQGAPAKGDGLSISGTEARALLRRGKRPPPWFMRPEISQALLRAQKRGRKIFVD